MATPRRLHILGTRGIPNRHGGFEACVERLAPHLAGHGWDVRVYCQQDGAREWQEDTWDHVTRIHVPVTQTGAPGSVAFDWKSTVRAVADDGLLLTFGFNTGLFFAWPWLKQRPHVVNLDGLEWRRAKWSRPVRGWLYVNAWLATWLPSALVADHPDIAGLFGRRPLARPIVTIPYGADALGDVDPAPVARLGLRSRRFALVVARAEPENSLLEMVTAWSRRMRGIPLVVVGAYDFARHPYHREVRAHASDEVRFVGAIYDRPVLDALRAHARMYLHGHTVGGTNPSLVEALGAGSAVLAHDNRFNRWVAGGAARYFRDVRTCADWLDAILEKTDVLDAMRQAARARHAEAFTWPRVLAAYEDLLASVAAGRAVPPRPDWTGCPVRPGAP